MDYTRFMVLNTVLGGYFGSRLMSNLREDKGYTYGIYSQTQIFRDRIILFITADVAAQATHDAVNEINLEIERLRQEPVSDAELERVRNFMMGDFIRSIDGTFEISERYRQMVVTDVDERLSTNLMETLATVTPDQLPTLAQSTLTDLVTVTAGA
jgi:predicted Zn-dependent peptidase